MLARVVAAAALVAAVAHARAHEVPTDRLIVRFHPGHATTAKSEAGREALAARMSSRSGEMMRPLRTMGDGSQVMQLFRRLSASQAKALAQRMAGDPEVAEVLADRIAMPALVPNDPQLADQWALGAASGVNAAAAWDITTGAANLIVGILDTGKLDHPGLAGRWIGGHDFVTDTNRSNDGDGRDANPADPGDWITSLEISSGALPGCQETSSRWHGTAMAGVIAATGNDSLGTAGLNWGSKLLPVRVVGKCGGYTSDIADGMRWAVGLPVDGVPANPNTADVLNVSLATFGACDSVWQSAIDDVVAFDVPVIVSAGNQGTSAANYSPGNCARVITVGAVNHLGRLPAYGNTGSGLILSAPGGSGSGSSTAVLTTHDSGAQAPASDGIFTALTGTSIAAAHVTGIASLMLSMNPTLLPHQVALLLQANSRAFPADAVSGEVNCNTSLCGAGIANAGGSVRFAKPFGHGPTTPMVASGEFNNAALRSDGAIFEWSTGAPALRQDLSSIRRIAGGARLYVGARLDGSIVTWSPVSAGITQFPSLTHVMAVAAGGNPFWLALRMDGTVWGAGYNATGALGDGSTEDRSSPVQAAIGDVAAISAGGYNALALKVDGTVWGWGSNNNGELGDGTTAQRLVPVPVTGASGVKAIASGYGHSLALKEDGTLLAWGANSYGQLGDGTTTSRSSPVPVPGINNVVAIAAGQMFTLALKGDGTVWGWGFNANGSLGDGGTTNRASPAPIAGLANIVAIGAGISRAYAVLADGGVMGWGGSASLPRLVIGPGESGTLDLDLAGMLFTAQSGIPLGALTASNSIVLSGIAAGSAISVTGGEYRIDAGGFTSAAGTVSAGQSVTLRLTAPATCATTATATVTFGAISRTFTVTTLPCDTTPDPLATLNPQGNVPAGSVRTSNALYLTGFNTGVPISVSGGEYSIGCNSTFTAASGTINPNTEVCVRQTASASADTVTTASLTVGPYTRDFRVITATGPGFSASPAVTADQYNRSGVRSDGVVFEWGYHPTGASHAFRQDYISGMKRVARSMHHLLGLRADGTVWAWGGGAGYGELGLGSYPTYPAPVPGLMAVTDISVSTYRSMALKSDGTVWAWGRNNEGQLGDGTLVNRDVPVQVSQSTGLTGVTAISAAYEHSLAVKSDGTVWAWGGVGSGKLGVTGGDPNRPLPLQVPGISNAIAVAAGEQHSLALKGDGTVWAWGYNGLGQLGDGSAYTGRETPAQVAGLTGIARIAAGTHHNLALKSDGTVWAWGYNATGLMGDGTATSRYTAIQVPGLEGIQAIGAAVDISMAVATDGRVYQWGSGMLTPTVVLGVDGVGTLNLDPTAMIFAPRSAVALGTVVTSNAIVLAGISAGTAISVTGGEYSVDAGAFASAPGTVSPGQSVTLRVTAASACGTVASVTITFGAFTRTFTATTTACDTTPDPLATLNPQGNVPAGSVRTSNALYLTGFNTAVPISVSGGEYSIGCNGTFTAASGTINPNTEVCVRQTASASTDTVTTARLTVGPFTREFRVITATGPGFSTVPSVVGTQYNRSGVRSDGIVFEWGYHPTGVGHAFPQDYISGVKKLARGMSHWLGLRADGTVWAWGGGGYGEMGLGSDPTYPAPIPGLTGVTDISTGFSNRSLALKGDGTVWAWGRNNEGQLGDGTAVNRDVPVQVSQSTGLTSVTAISAAYEHSLAVKSDGTVWAWGGTGMGKLGVTGEAPNRPLPLQVPGVSNAVAVAAGEQHSLALKSDGTVWAWGYDGLGQLGDGSADTGRHTPAQVAGLTGMVAIAAATHHNLALKSDGTVWAWGYNATGLMGDGTTTSRPTPIQVPGLEGIRAIGVAVDISLAVAIDGTVYQWGSGMLTPTVVLGVEGVGTLNLDPTSMLFTPRSGLALGTVVTSNAIVLSGIDPGSAISVTGGDYRIDAGAFTGAPGTVNPGQSVTLRVATASACGTAASVTITFGGLTRTFTATTLACDTTPDTPTIFQSQGNVPAGSVRISNNLYFGGFNAPVPISITGGQYSIGCNGTFTATSGTINPNTEVCVRQTASATADTVTTASLTVGPFTRDFRIITATGPGFSAFPSVTGNQYNRSGGRSDGVVFEWGYHPTGVRHAFQQDYISGVKKLARGLSHWLGLRADGTVWAWGGGGYGEMGLGSAPTYPAPIPGLAGVTDISTGFSYRSMALKGDGTVWTWGRNNQGQLGDGTLVDRDVPVQVSQSTGLTGVVAISAAYEHSLAVKSDGTVWAWGNVGFGKLGVTGGNQERPLPLQVPGISNVIAVAAGEQHSLALKSDGSVWGWGYNGLGQLGDGSAYTGRHTPAPVAGLTGIVAIAAGTHHSLALKSDGTVWAWGHNSTGVLGDGTTTSRYTAIQVPGVAGIQAIGTAVDISLAVATDGTVYQWGSGMLLPTLVLGVGGNGPLNLVVAGLRPDSFTFQPAFATPTSTAMLSNTIVVSGLGTGVSSPITVTGGTISINGGAFSAASRFVMNGDTVRVQVVSAPDFEALASATVGIGGATGREASFHVQTQRDPARGTASPAVSLGDGHSLLLNANGNVFGFGYNANGQLGTGSTFSTASPTPAAGVAGIAAIASGANHVLALETDGTLRAWGYNGAGQLGNGATQASVVNAVPVSGLVFVKAISAGRNHSLALNADGTVRAWGLNSEGQVGDGSGASVRTLPVAVAATNVVAIAAGGRHSLALRGDGTVLAWGANESGQLGDGSTSLRTTPVLVDISNVIAIAAGGAHSLALKSDGSVWAWGANGFGQLGDGSTTNRSSPVAATGLGSGVGLIASGEAHSLAVKVGGSVYAWGNNANSQLGTGDNTNRPVPTLLAAPTGVVAIAGGSRHSAALDSLRNVHVWGDNFFGQVGNRSGNYSPQSGALNMLRGDSVISTSAGGTGSGVGTGNNSGSSVLLIDGLGTGFDFGTRSAGSSVAITGKYANQSPGEPIDQISLGASGNGFSLAGTDCPGSLQPLTDCTFTVAFTPPGPASYYGELVVSSSVVGSPERRGLVGTGAPSSTPTISFAAGGVDFPPQEIGVAQVRTLRLTNTGSAPLTGVNPVATTLGDFSALHTCQEIAPGASCEIQVRFAPLATGNRAAQVRFSSNAAGSPHAVAVLGTGVAATTPSGYPLTVSTSGSGRVTSSPASIDCGTNCIATFASGASVILTATPASGFVFTGWSGSCGGTGTCQVTMGQARSVGATFEPAAYSLTVTRAGTGSGTVTSSPAGIDCGASCSGSFARGSIVTLTATAATGSTFAGWTGACGGTSTCQVTMSTARSVGATFQGATGSLDASTYAVDFGGQSMRTTSRPRQVSLRNMGGASITIQSIVVTDPQFAQSSDCGTLAAGGACTVSLTFTPSVKAGAINTRVPAVASLTVTHGGPGGSLAIALNGVSEKSLVTHYYQSILGRAPDAGGVPYWEGEAARVAALGANVNETWFALAQTFYTSPEYLAFNRDATGFVTDLYATFFNRAPDAGGLAYWISQISQGMPKEVVLVSFMFSPEFTSFTQSIFGTTAARAEVDTVIDFYRGILSRLPDSGGFEYWVGQFRAAQCQGPAAVYTQVERISSAYMNSPEYLARARSNSQYMGDVYNAFMRRGGDLGGMQYWISQLDSGVRTRENVRQAFITTPEFGARVQAIINQGCFN